MKSFSLKTQNRIVFAILFFLTIGLGLLTRMKPEWFFDFFAEYGGDALWALMVFWGFAFVFPKNARKSFLLALSFSFLIEFSQLYQADWINAVRATTFGALVLGHGFLWTDLICYTVGVSIGGCVVLAKKWCDDQR